MEPKVLVWALLFVIAVGVAYRLLGRVLNRQQHAEGELPIPERPPAADVQPLASASELPISEAHVSAEYTQGPAAPVDLQSIILPRATAAAAAAIAARELTVVSAPDVKATLPPAAVAMADTAPSASLSPSTVVGAVAIPVTIRLRGTRLRARRIGLAMTPLDERIKETQSRRLHRRPKVRRKQGSLTKTPRKAPPRRIGVGPKGSDAFASAKAATRVVGVPHRTPRVRVAAAH